MARSIDSKILQCLSHRDHGHSGLTHAVRQSVQVGRGHAELRRSFSDVVGIEDQPSAGTYIALHLSEYQVQSAMAVHGIRAQVVQVGVASVPLSEDWSQSIDQLMESA